MTVAARDEGRGLRVAVAGDNCRDPFYAYGDHDMLDTFTQAVKILHLDHPHRRLDPRRDRDAGRDHGHRPRHDSRPARRPT